MSQVRAGTQCGGCDSCEDNARELLVHSAGSTLDSVEQRFVNSSPCPGNSLEETGTQGARGGAGHVARVGMDKAQGGDTQHLPW